MMKKLTALALIAVMLLSTAVAFAAEAKIPYSARNLYADQKAVVAEKSIVADPEWSLNKSQNIEVAALGQLFASTKESAAVSGNYYEWLVMQGFDHTAGRHAEAVAVDPFSTDMDCIGSILVINAKEFDFGTFKIAISERGKKVTTVAAAYDDEEIKGIIAEYACDINNSLICYSVLANVNGKTYLFHYNANGYLMEVTFNAAIGYTYGYTYDGEVYTSKTKLEEAIAEDKAKGTYNKKNKVTFDIVQAGPTKRNWILKRSDYPTIHFTRVSPSLAEMINGIGY